VYTNVKREKTYIAFYVDDFLIAGENGDDIATIKSRLAERFDMKESWDCGEVPWDGD
jgi:hypothetical protein